MEVLVLLKLVTESHFTDALYDAEDRLSTGRLVMNPADEYALEQALRLRDVWPDTHVTVLTMSPPSAEHLLYEALAMGAAAAVHLCDDAFAGSDTLATARTLAAAVRRRPPADLILCGQRAIDSETGHIGPQLAVLLGMPCITNVVSVRREPGGLILNRLQDSGLVTLVPVLPAVLTICRGTDMVRSPSIPGLRSARKKKILRLDHTRLALPEEQLGSAGSPTRVVRTERIRHDRRSGTGTDQIAEGVSAILRLAGKSDGNDA